jgi:ATP sulfurylase
VVAFQCRNPIHRAHYELFTRALDAPQVNSDKAVVLVHPTCGPTQADDIPGTVRYQVSVCVFRVLVCFQLPAVYVFFTPILLTFNLTQMPPRIAYHSMHCIDPTSPVPPLKDLRGAQG